MRPVVFSWIDIVLGMLVQAVREKTNIWIDYQPPIDPIYTLNLTWSLIAQFQSDIYLLQRTDIFSIVLKIPFSTLLSRQMRKSYSSCSIVETPSTITFHLQFTLANLMNCGCCKQRGFAPSMCPTLMEITGGWPSKLSSPSRSGRGP